MLEGHNVPDGVIESFQRLARVATKAALEGGPPLNIRAPLIDMTKAEIIRRGLALGVDGKRFVARVAGADHRSPRQFRQFQPRLKPAEDHPPNGRPGVGRCVAGRDKLAQLRGRNEQLFLGML